MLHKLFRYLFMPPHPERPVTDGFGFELINNENSQGCHVSVQGEQAWREWMKSNPPPNDGHRYESSALYPQWRRLD